jgi:hypothetical protein
MLMSYNPQYSAMAVITPTTLALPWTATRRFGGVDLC